MENKWKKIWEHPWVVGACNLLLVMCLYTVSRLFFYYVNIDLFPNVSTKHLLEMLLGGIRFDLTTLLYSNSLYLLLILIPLPHIIRNHTFYIRLANWSFIIPNIICFIINTIDIVYVRFTDRRTTCRFFSEFQNDNNLFHIFWQSIWQYWYVTIFGCIIIIVLCLFMRKNWQVRSYKPIVYYTKEAICMCITIYFVVIGIRGGFGRYTRPITISNALQYTNTPRETSVILNTPFSILKSIENTTYTHPHYYSNIEVEKHMTPVHENDTINDCCNENVVILILESFSKEYIGYYNTHIDGGHYRGYTPFLDSLLMHCVTYRDSYAAGRKSIDAMPSILSSIPMLIEPYVVTPYSTNNISSIASCLKEMGYYTAFFHGAPNGSMGFQAYARHAGFDDYFGKDNYDGIEAFDGTWAIWDEEFLQYFARRMNTMHEPFFTTVFTASSHHPFKVPQLYEGVFDKGTLPIHQCIGYTDHALQQFFEYAKKQDWYENTLFVLTADHTNETFLPEYKNAKGLFEIPIAFYSPRWNQGKLHTSFPVSQTDILPSILAYLGYKKPYIAFGEDILTMDKEHPYAICYNNPVFQIISDSLLLQFDGTNVTAVYNHQQDPSLSNNIVDKIDTHDMLIYLKAYIQQYIDRLINNKLTLGTDGSTS